MVFGVLALKDQWAQNKTKLNSFWSYGLPEAQLGFESKNFAFFVLVIFLFWAVEMFAKNERFAKS